MIKYYRKEYKTEGYFIIYIEDKIYNLKFDISILYKLKTNSIKEVSFCNKANYLNSFEEIPEFEVLFDTKYTILLKKALEFHNKKYSSDTVFNKIVKKYNILNFNGN